MMSAPSPGKITFLVVFRRTRYRFFCWVGLALMVVGLFPAVILQSMSPTGHTGTSSNVRVDFEVKESTEPPVVLTLSHTFPLAVSGSSYTLLEGPSSIDYTLVIASSTGREINAWNSTIGLSWWISDYEGGNSYTKTDTTPLDLPVGKYTMSLTATHPIDYAIVQSNRLGLQIQVVSLIGFLGILLIVLSLVLTWNARNELGRLRVRPEPPASGGWAEYPGGGLAHYPPAYNLRYGTPPPPVSKVEYEVDHICARCGHLIRNPVIQNVMICERCGEREYIG